MRPFVPFYKNIPFHFTARLSPPMWLSIVSMLALLFFFGCAPIKVKDNTIYTDLYSVYPNYNIQVNPDLTYIGKAFTETTMPTPTGKRLRYRFTSHIFLDAENHTVKRGISFERESIETFYQPDLYRHVKYRLESGKMKLGGRQWQFIVTLIHPKPDNYITRFISEKGGYRPPPCGLAIIVSRITGEKNNRLVGIRYFEDIAESGYDCVAWEEKEKLTERQQSYLKGFKKRFRSAFDFVPCG